MKREIETKNNRCDPAIFVIHYEIFISDEWISGRGELFEIMIVYLKMHRIIILKTQSIFHETKQKRPLSYCWYN